MFSLRCVVFCTAILFGPLIAFDRIQSQDAPPSENDLPQPVQKEAEEATESASSGSAQSVDVQAQVPVSESGTVEQNTQADSTREQSPADKADERLVSNAETAPQSEAKPISTKPQGKKEDDTSWPKMKLRARIMTGWEYRAERPAEAQGGDSDSEQQLFLQQARIGLKAELIKRVIANISAELSDGLRPVETSADYEEVPYLRNAYINVRVKKAFQIRAGRFKRPFSRLENTSTGSLPFRGRGLSNELVIEDAQWGDRAIGLMFWGKIPKLNLTWSGSISNPDWGVDNDMETAGIDTIGRLSYEPIKWLSVGVNYGHKLLEFEANGSVNVNAFGGDFRLRFGGFRLTAEAFAAQLPEEVDHPFAFGVVGYTSYDFELLEDLVLQPTLFGEYADANADNSQTEAIRTIIGINLLLYEDLRILPQVEIIRPLGEVSSYNPWVAEENFYILLSLQI
jgi:hypothetical protein